MISLRLLLLGFIVIPYTYGQDDTQAIREWQSQHPSVMFISADRFATMTDDEKALLKEYIIFNGKITVKDLQSWETQNPEKSGSHVPSLSVYEANAVKQWRGENQDVKIVSRSVYDQAQEEVKQSYLSNPRCLILIGEHLTAKDIDLFEKR